MLVELVDAEEQSTNQIRASEEEVWLLGYSEYKNLKPNKRLQFHMTFLLSLVFLCVFTNSSKYEIQVNFFFI